MLYEVITGNQEEWLTLRINPGIPINPEATRIHGITDEDVVITSYSIHYTKLYESDKASVYPKPDNSFSTGYRLFYLSL